MFIYDMLLGIPISLLHKMENVYKHSKVTVCIDQGTFFTGGLFDLAESKQEVAFRYAVERVNANRKILSQSLLSAIIEKIPPQDSFHASKRGKMTLIFLSKEKQ